jgi:putative protease
MFGDIMKRPELLAPAGSYDSLIAAVMAGCDAVYLSGKKYGARSFASNFSDDEIVSAVSYCHLYGVKVYVTVNTIIYEKEVDDFIKYIDFIHRNNVDAVIMQDIGMVDLVRKLYPNLEIHISTQMHVHNYEGVKFFEKMGLKRIVLAREVDLETIRYIKENSSVDIEVFVHGALCFSYSGQCLMSSLIGGRSGNRGACAQCCRLPYDVISDGKVINKGKYPISTKDLMTLEHIGDLIESGIDSFKIEGRMKRPEYVYLVVSLYRKAIDSYLSHGIINIDEQDIIDLKKIFNRGFTSGFLFNNKNIINSNRPNHMGVSIGKVIDYKNNYVYIKLTDSLNLHDGIRIVGKNDVGLTLTRFFVKNKPVTSASSGSIVSFRCDRVLKNSDVLKTTDSVQISLISDMINRNSRKVFITGLIKLNRFSNLYLELFDGINKVSVTGDMVMDAFNSPITRDKVMKQIDRLGNTVFSFEKLDIIIDDDVFVSVSSLNDLRRRAISLLEEKRLYSTNYVKKSYYIDVTNFSNVNEHSCLINDKSLYSDSYDYVYVDNYDLFNCLDSVYYKVPRVITNYPLIDSRVLVGEYGSLYKYKNVDTDFSFNVVNSYSVAFLHSIGVNKITLSLELSLDGVKDLIDSYHTRYSAHPNLEVIYSAYEEVMVSKYNLFDVYKIDNAKLRDRFGNLYPIKVKDNVMYIYNYKKRELNYQMYYDIGVNVARINL